MRIAVSLPLVFSLLVCFGVNAELSKKYATHEELVYPEALGDLRYANVQRKAGEQVVFRFVKKKRDLSKYPHKTLLAIAWLEILYNEMVKNPKSKDDADVESLYNTKTTIRENIGMSEQASTQEVVDRYVVISKLLSFAKLEKHEIPEGLQHRKEVISYITSSVKDLKKKYSDDNISEDLK